MDQYVLLEVLGLFNFFVRLMWNFFWRFNYVYQFRTCLLQLNTIFNQSTISHIAFKEMIFFSLSVFWFEYVLKLLNQKSWEAKVLSQFSAKSSNDLIKLIHLYHEIYLDSSIEKTLQAPGKQGILLVFYSVNGHTNFWNQISWNSPKHCGWYSHNLNWQDSR